MPRPSNLAQASKRDIFLAIFATEQNKVRSLYGKVPLEKYVALLLQKQLDGVKGMILRLN